MNGLNQYRSYQVDTAGPEERVALLYDGARRFLDQAGAALEAKDYPAVSKWAGKAQRILTELEASLDFSAGEIAQNLFRLYDYWNWRVTQGITKKDPAALREVSAALSDMHEAWAEAAKQIRAQRGMAAHG